MILHLPSPHYIHFTLYFIVLYFIPCIHLFSSVAADYPYINYYVINKSREEAGQFYTNNKLASHEELNAGKLGYSLAHSMDLYDEVSPGMTNCSS